MDISFARFGRLGETREAYSLAETWTVVIGRLPTLLIGGFRFEIVFKLVPLAGPEGD